MENSGHAPHSPIIRRIIALWSTRGWSQSQLARQAGIDRRVISSLMRGDQESALPSTLDALADALGTTGAYLRGETSDPQRPFIVVPTGSPIRGRRVRVSGDDPTRRFLAKTDRTPFDAEAWTDDAEERARWAAAPLDPVIVYWLTSPHLPVPDRQRYGSGGFRDALPIYRADEDGAIVLPVDREMDKKVPRPPALWGIAGAYVVVAPHGWEPRYRAGERLFIAPGTKLTPGDDVLVLERIRPVAPDGFEALVARCRRLHTLVNGDVSVADLETGLVSPLKLGAVAFLHRVVMTSAVAPIESADPR